MTKTFKLGGIFLITVVMLMAFRIITGFINLSDNVLGWLFSFIFQVGIMGIMPYALYRVWIVNDTKLYLNDFRLKAKINPLSYPLAVVIGFAVFYLNLVISAFIYLILNGFGYTYVSGVGTIYSSPEVLILEIITSAVLPGIFEEITDRGLFLAILDGSGKDEKFKILFIGIMFGFLHQNVAQLGSAAFAGVILTYMAIKCSSIFPSMIVHFMNNFLITMYTYSSQKGGFFNKFLTAVNKFTFSNIIYAFVVGAAVFGLLYVLLVQFKKINAGSVSQKENADRVLPMQSENIIKNLYSIPVNEFEMIYGDANGERKRVEEELIPEKPIITAEKPVNKKLEYAFLAIACVTAVVTTIYSYIWGLLR